VLHSARLALHSESLKMQILGGVSRQICAPCRVGRDGWIVLDCPQYPIAREREVLKLMMGVSRTRSAGAKVTDEEYVQLAALAQARGLTLGEWCREVLLAQLKRPVASLPEETILAEVVALSMIMINLLRAPGSEETLTPEKVQEVIRWADTEKLTTAAERLRHNEGRRDS
jgi:hypothetical protein